MVAPNSLRPQPDRRLPAPPHPEPVKQQRLMLMALTLLLITLGVVLYHDRDFWFPETIEAENQPMQSAAPANATSSVPSSQPSSPHKRSQSRSLPFVQSAPAAQPAPVADSGAPVTITRTVLPPLEVEVIAGSAHRTLRPSTNSVQVDMEPTGSSQEAPEAASQDTKNTAASITVNAAEQVQAPPQTTDIVEHSVRPGYPMLARQMKVQGSVILQALIGRDGLIQDLHVLSGPPILATAAREAVKQWHFKPHYEAGTPVETQAKITVNFTISTN